MLPPPAMSTIAIVALGASAPPLLTMAPLSAASTSMAMHTTVKSCTTVMSSAARVCKYYVNAAMARMMSSGSAHAPTPLHILASWRALCARQCSRMVSPTRPRHATGSSRSVLATR